MKVDQAGIDLITSFEGFSPVRYLCPAGKSTISFGHVIRDGEHFDEPMTESEGLSLLLMDLPSYEAHVLDLVEESMTQGMFNALTSFVYNLGPHALETSTLLKLLNAGSETAAADEFLKWDKATVNGKKITLPGLTRRREAEREMFLTT